VTERRFFVRPEDADDARIVLRAEEAHHARRVLRLAAGDEVLCFDGRGHVWRGRLEAFGRDSASVSVTETLASERPRVPELTLAQGWLKGDRMDAVVQKATELGAARILAIRTDRSEVRVDGERAERRSQRWRRIVVEAAKQCERAWIPDVANMPSVEAVLDAAGVAWIAFVERDGEPPHAALTELRGAPSIGVLVGPEGGWSERERSIFAARRVRGLSLGSDVLRADTAAVAALAIVQFALSPRD